MHFGFAGLLLLVLLVIAQGLWGIYVAASQYRAEREERAAQFFDDATRGVL